MRFQKKSPVRKGFLLILAAAVFMLAANVHAEQSRADTYEGLKLFSDVIEELEKNYVEPVDTRDLIEEAIHGMVESLDPHSTFMPPEAFEDLQSETRGDFGGIGIVITKENGRLTVVSPIEGTPAYKAGIQANDVIVAVEGESTQDMMLWEAVKQMRGEPGTELRITVVREGADEPMEFTLVRAEIPMDSVRHIMLQPGYGYLWVTNFRENTTDEVKKAMADLEKNADPLKGLILDLRDNPGGLLTQAVSLSDLFLEQGRIVSIRGRNQKEESVYRAEADNDEPDYPVVVLINGGSASAAEIVAGALQDNGRALVLGTTSFGKGSVQTVRPLRNGYGLKYTVARYYTPKGVSIQAEGIHPDLVVRRRLLDEKTGGLDARRIKEGDLKNHLPGKMELEEDSREPKPSETNGDKPADAKQDDKTDTQKLMRLRDSLYEHSDKNPDALMLDSQINRAYEILRGYEVFSAMDKPGNSAAR